MKHPSETPNTLRFSRRLALGLLASSAAACARPFPSPEASGGAKSEHPLIVLVAIDGVRWQDVFWGSDKGLLGSSPAIAREVLVPSLIEMEAHGTVLGAPSSAGFFASGPDFVSLPGYMEMLSGTADTGCFTNECRTTSNTTLLDDYLGATARHPAVAGAFASWPQVEFAAASQKKGVVSAGRQGGFNLDLLRSYPKCAQLLSQGHRAQDNTGAESGFRPDSVTGKLAQTFITEASPDFVFISLGETDEWGHQGNYPAYLQALISADRLVGHLRGLLARSGRETALLVTTDHGRSNDFLEHGAAHPESARSFLFAEGSLIRAAGRVDQGAAYLKDIAPTVRSVADLSAPASQNQGRVLSELLRSPFPLPPSFG